MSLLLFVQNEGTWNSSSYTGTHPTWLWALALTSLSCGLFSFVVIVADMILYKKHRQHMWIMNGVWPVTATYGTLLALVGWFTLAYGSNNAAMDDVMKQHHHNDQQTQSQDKHMSETREINDNDNNAFGEDVESGRHTSQHEYHHSQSQQGESGSCEHGGMSMKEMMDMMPSHDKPFWLTVLVGTTHCGAGCVLGDIVGEWVATVFTVGGYELFAGWLIDFTFAYVFGIFYQFWTIKPMRETGVWDSLKSAIIADSLSIASFQVGMYAWMSIFQLVIFGNGAPTSTLGKNDIVFWWMEQVAMCWGIIFTYPMNWFLITHGIKEVCG